FLIRRSQGRARAARAGVAVLATLLLFSVWTRAPAQNPPPVLTTAAAVRVLPPHKLREGKPVRLRGIITYRDQKWGFVIMQDETGGVPVTARSSDLPLAIGHRVEVEGV